MEKTIFRKGKRVKYCVQGNGDALVLLHGYLESLRVWDGFAEDLSEKYQVIRVDLPGFGESDPLDLFTSIEGMAESVKIVLEAENIQRCIIVGHSMGGYAALAFAEEFESMLKGLCLFHSSPFPDTEEKKADRQREIDLIHKGKKEQLISVNIPRTFADDNLAKFDAEIETIKKIGLQTKDEGIEAALKGMMQRSNRLHVLRMLSVPVLLIAGAKDNYIPLEVAERIRDASNIQLQVLEQSGHMGFMEEKEKSIQLLDEFIAICE